jgi:hypothetical protein
MRVVSTSVMQQSTLAELASCFHQDFALMEVNPDQWGKEFIKPLSIAKKRALRDELREFSAAYPGKSAKAYVTHGFVLAPTSGLLPQIYARR